MSPEGHFKVSDNRPELKPVN